MEEIFFRRKKIEELTLLIYFEQRIKTKFYIMRRKLPIQRRGMNYDRSISEHYCSRI